MTAKLTIPIFIAVFIVVFLTTGFAFNGQAFSPANTNERGGHSQVNISGYIVDISIKINKENPERVAAILLNVSAPNGKDTANVVQISLDDGETWGHCNLLWGQSWQCEFISNAEPFVADIENLQISTQGMEQTSGHGSINF